jgi:hypothetical protein
MQEQRRERGKNTCDWSSSSVRRLCCRPVPIPLQCSASAAEPAMHVPANSECSPNCRQKGGPAGLVPSGLQVALAPLTSCPVQTTCTVVQLVLFVTWRAGEASKTVALPLPLLACCFTNDDDLHVVTQLPPMDAWMDKHSELRASGSQKGSIDLGEDTIRPRSFSSEGAIPQSLYKLPKELSVPGRSGNGS